MRIKDIIAHLFDFHVMDKRNWTLERLIAWVETVEPKEIQPEDAWSRVIQQRELRTFELQRSRQEAQKRLNQEIQEVAAWQSVRDAFEARHASRRKRTLP
jgi:hypothetical protein